MAQLPRFPKRPQPVTPLSWQESVWDYPRPPVVQHRSERIVVRLGGRIIADTVDSVRVLETSHPPVYYLPFEAFPAGVLIPVEGGTFCEFKGMAAYFDVVANSVVACRGGWTYPEPTQGFEALRTRVALYPGRMESCEIDGEPVTAQSGGFYGGWITRRIVGPFKGEPGSAGW